jgi:predicted RecA/RadA family phage recombinase
MKNKIQDGSNLTVTAAANITSGDGVRMGMLFGVAQATVLSGADVVLATEGVFELPKLSAQAWTVGQAIFWTGTQCTTVTTGNLFIGVATAVAVNPSATGLVRLNGSMPAALSA